MIYCPYQAILLMPHLLFQSDKKLFLTLIFDDIIINAMPVCVKFTPNI